MNAVARRATAAHALPDILRTARPTEEFPLIDSKVETEMPETDLFAGMVAE